MRDHSTKHLLTDMSGCLICLPDCRSQYQAASAAIKVYAAQQKIEAWQREQEHKAERAAADAAKAAKEAAGKPGLVGAAVAAVAGCHTDVESVTPATGAAPSAGGEDAAGGSGAAGSIDDGKAAAAKRALEAERAKMEEAALPLMLEAMWAANVLDIQVRVGWAYAGACSVRIRSVCSIALAVGSDCDPVCMYARCVHVKRRLLEGCTLRLCDFLGLVNTLMVLTLVATQLKLDLF